MRLTILACVVAGPVWANACPEPPDHAAALSDLIKAAREAPDEATGRALSGEMWALWADAPDAKAQELLDEAMERRRVADYDGATKAVDALIAYCPDYSEGYNQRAFINFLREDFAAALPDLDRTLDITPRHTGALTGRALTLAALGRNAEATLSLRAALNLNPWLGERRLLQQLEQQEQDL
ncbi:tetratricopeptide repeat protein [Roseovarius phycicola]|uniref:Tetratricopeptide repeat protein n=1 Tax=Roseovarius phycicola TaxID=3080976 RepID=A0ABZ2HIH1_9RHOB